METLSIVYLIGAVILLGFLIFERSIVIYQAQRKRWGQIVWDVLAILLAIFIFLQRQNADLVWGSVFVLAFVLLMAGWKAGFTRNMAIINLRKMDQYEMITNYEVFEIDAKLSLVKLYAGDVLLGELKVLATPEIMKSFLKKKIKLHREN